jgi:teichuronic acid biosynthesis glycosyltransferase TuaC
MEDKLKVLFVSGGNSSSFDIAPFIKAQGQSLADAGLSISYFTVKGKGFLGYLRNAALLRRFLKKNTFDLIHAHYTLSGWTAVLAFSRIPVVLSLMGSDAYGDYTGHNKVKFGSRVFILLTYMIQPFVSQIICKSEFIRSFVYLKKKAHVIPNGILLGNFQQLGNYKKELGLEGDKQYVLFLGNKGDKRKNFKLANASVELLNDRQISLITPYPVSHQEVVKYFNSVDVLVVPSFMEGSANVIKEAMACNCPVIATDVGDAKWVFGDTPGHFISGFSPEAFAGKLKLALDFSREYGRTNGRQRLLDLGLDSATVAGKIMEIYKTAAIEK